MRTFFMLFLCLPFMGLEAQMLFEPTELQAALQQETRTRTGVPGKKYWQNSAAYYIKASYHADSALITGHLSVMYKNQSPDTLKKVYLKLMQNVYAKGSPRAWETNPAYLHQGVRIGNVYIDSCRIEPANRDISSTLLHLEPEQGIAPGAVAAIYMDFTTPMQKQIKYRSGALDSATLFAGYWFPQLCVYDDIFGWDRVQYMLNTENYNDFSNYLVELTLPGNYVVWATGQQLNPEETFQNPILRKITKSKKSRTPVQIIALEDYANNKVLREGDSLVWKFEAQNMPDFAWGASTHFMWEGAAALNPDDKNTCWVQSAYPEVKGKNDDARIVEYAQKAVELFSNTFPGVAYPYAAHITFMGGKSGGMEFPMIANNTSYDSTYTSVVVAHEIAHNYFPFYMGINERKFGWFDEMFTTQMENLYLEQHFPAVYKRSLKTDKHYAEHYNGTFSDVPLMVESSQITNRRTMVNNFYMKSNDMLNALKSVIGDANLSLYLQEFIQTWAGKHPTPYDFFNYVNHKSMVNLNWFWNRWAFQFGSVDLEIITATKNNFQVLNKGGRPVPFKVEMKLEDGALYEEVYNAGIWEENEKVTLAVPEHLSVQKITLTVTNNIFETTTSNNTLEMGVSKQAN